MNALRFAATKIQPPRQRAARLERPALQRALQQAVRNHRVVLLQAPAGFGKTSLLASLLALPAPAAPGSPGAGLASAWVALDEDDDAERLLACLVAALEPHDVPWRAAPEALVALASGDAAQLRRAAAGLVNALAGCEVAHGVLVLDDLHRVHSPSALALLQALTERLPAQWTLLLASRTAPPPALALARLRAAGEMAEFTRQQLCFDPAEVAALLAAEALPVEQAGPLHRRTAGWPACLRLVLAAARGSGSALAAAVGGADAGRPLDRHLFEYLAAEVLDNLPPALHDFLLRSAVLPELTAPRAAAVSGDARAAEWLDDIERRGLFATPLEAQERTLVLHDLFRQALLQRQRERLADETPALLRRAAAGEPDTLRRVGFLLRAGDWPAAEAALAADAETLFVRGGAGEVLRLAEQFPPDRRSARLANLAAAASAIRWRWVAMAAWCEHAVRAARADGDVAELRLAQARLAYALYPLDRNAEAEALIAELQPEPLAPPARAALLMADCMQHFRRHPHARLPLLYGELLTILEAGAPLFRWWEMAPPYSWATIAGMAPLLQRYIDGATARLGDEPLPMRADLRLLSAVLLTWAGDLAQAAASLHSAEDDIRWLAVSGETQAGVGMLGAIHAAMRGDGSAAARQLQALLRLEEDPATERRDLWRHQIAVYGVRLSDTLGDVAGLRHWAGLLRENPLHNAAAQNSRAIAVRARCAAAEGRWADAVGHFEQLAATLPGIDVMGQRTDLTLRFSHALLRLDRVADAAAVLAPALDRVAGDGAHGQPLLCGLPLLQTLAGARWGPGLTAAQQATLRAAAAQSAALRGAAAAAAAVAAPPDAAVPRPAAAAAAAGNGETLSARELEVLQRMATGNSNKLIARELDISPHTVKRHVANILDKLDLGSRGQAAAWLHARGG